MLECTDKIKVPGLFFSLFIANGKKYVVPNWIEVPMETTEENIELVTPLKSKPTRVIVADQPIRVEVASSTGKGTYTVERLSSGRWTCTCPVYTYRNAECKHIKQTK